MQRKNKFFLATIGVPFLLSSCEIIPLTSFSSLSALPSETSSSSLSSSISVPEGTLSLLLARTKVRSGSDFFDGTGATLRLGASDISLSADVRYDVSKGGVSFEPGQVLTETGDYSVTATYYDKTDTKTFSVIASTPAAGKEGVGYRTIAANDAKDTRVGLYDHLGVLGPGKCPSLGTVKLLVIPVGFQDTDVYTSDELSNIQKSYFGTAEETGWQSLASYYDKSSYHNLTLTGVVGTPYTASQTCYQFEQAYNDSHDALADLIQKAAAQAILNGNLTPSDFDVNGDGYYDGVELVYKTTRLNYREGGNAVWWCFTGSLGTQPGGQGKDPTIYRYFWSLYSYIENGYYTPNIDCHTLIHETGHMLGLNDYYSYNTQGENATNEYPCGGSDMMDMNIGDHNAYSKYLLGWVRPRYLDGSSKDFTMTLRSFESSGDCVILKSTSTDPFNQTPYDEYLMLSYYTPTGVNEKDSTGYKEWTDGTRYAGKTGHGGTYAKAGLQAFHIDNRAGNYNGSTWSMETNKLVEPIVYSLVEKKADLESNLVKIDTTSHIVTASPSFKLADNTDLYSEEIVDHALVKTTPNREIELLPGNGIDYFGVQKDRNFRHLGLQDNLFGLSSYEAGGTNYTNYAMRGLFPKGTAFNDGSVLDYSWSVSAQNDSEITLRFVSNQ